MSKVVVITGASSGFGALTARALAVAGHRVYAGMRETVSMRTVDSMFSSTTQGIWFSDPQKRLLRSNSPSSTT